MTPATIPLVVNGFRLVYLIYDNTDWFVKPLGVKKDATLYYKFNEHTMKAKLKDLRAKGLRNESMGKLMKMAKITSYPVPMRVWEGVFKHDSPNTESELKFK